MPTIRNNRSDKSDKPDKSDKSDKPDKSDKSDISDESDESDGWHLGKHCNVIVIHHSGTPPTNRKGSTRLYLQQGLAVRVGRGREGSTRLQCIYDHMW